jgi:tRNA-splicing ligase RtcB (3'-phosphate/5'-hydroxy nucleic acid ligase)
MRIIDGIPVWGTTVDEGALAQIRNCARTADHVAMMGDHHKGYSIPIGGVVAYADSISPSGVGFDIACGNKAILTDAPASEVRANIARIMDEVWSAISFGIGRKNDDERVDHDLFDDPAWSISACAPHKEMARQQLGTVGSGNHYVDIFTDEQDRVWVGVHFGSRGLGHKTATWFLKAAGASDGMDVDPCILPVASDLGAQYLEGMRLGGLYAYAGRDWVCSRVAKILGASVLEEVHNHHNFAWRETHNGRDLWVVRKGATPAFPGQRGFVGGSMGDVSVIIEGIENDQASQSLYSTVHGAGRVMGRMEAKGKPAKPGRHVTQTNGSKVWVEPNPGRVGKVTQAMMDEWVTRERVELRGAGLDESPHCYKRLPEVLAEHDSSIKILHTLTPLGVAMASPFEHDPFKD